MTSNLTNAISVVRGWGRTRVITANLAISATVDKALSYKRAVTVGLTISAIVSLARDYLVTVISNLSTSITVTKTLVYKRAIDTGLTIAATIIATFSGGVHYLITVGANLKVSAYIRYCSVLKDLIRLPIARADIVRLSQARHEFWRRIRRCE